MQTPSSLQLNTLSCPPTHPPTQFCHSWERSCADLVPAWLDAARKLKRAKVHIGALDCAAHEEACRFLAPPRAGGPAAAWRAPPGAQAVLFVRGAAASGEGGGAAMQQEHYDGAWRADALAAFAHGRARALRRQRRLAAIPVAPKPAAVPAPAPPAALLLVEEARRGGSNADADQRPLSSYHALVPHPAASAAASYASVSSPSPRGAAAAGYRPLKGSWSALSAALLGGSRSGCRGAAAAAAAAASCALAVSPGSAVIAVPGPVVAPPVRSVIALPAANATAAYTPAAEPDVAAPAADAPAIAAPAAPAASRNHSMAEILRAAVWPWYRFAAAARAATNRSAALAPVPLPAAAQQRRRGCRMAQPQRAWWDNAFAAPALAVPAAAKQLMTRPSAAEAEAPRIPRCIPPVLRHPWWREWRERHLGWPASAASAAEEAAVLASRLNASAPAGAPELAAKPCGAWPNSTFFRLGPIGLAWPAKQTCPAAITNASGAVAAPRAAAPAVVAAAEPALHAPHLGLYITLVALSWAVVAALAAAVAAPRGAVFARAAHLRRALAAAFDVQCPVHAALASAVADSPALSAGLAYAQAAWQSAAAAAGRAAGAIADVLFAPVEGGDESRDEAAAADRAPHGEDSSEEDAVMVEHACAAADEDDADNKDSHAADASSAAGAAGSCDAPIPSPTPSLASSAAAATGLAAWLLPRAAAAAPAAVAIAAAATQTAAQDADGAPASPTPTQLSLQSDNEQLLALAEQAHADRQAARQALLRLESAAGAHAAAVDERLSLLAGAAQGAEATAAAAEATAAGAANRARSALELAASASDAAAALAAEQRALRAALLRVCDALAAVEAASASPAVGRALLEVRMQSEAFDEALADSLLAGGRAAAPAASALVQLPMSCVSRDDGDGAGGAGQRVSEGGSSEDGGWVEL